MPGHLSNHFSNTTLSKVPPMMVPLSLFKMFIRVTVSSQCVLISAVQRSESALHIHVSPLFLCFLPVQVTTECWVEFPELTVGSHSLSILYLVVSVCPSQSPNSSHPPPSCLCVQSLVLSLCASISALEIGLSVSFSRASLVIQLVKNPPAMRETWVWSLGWEDPLEKGKATHSTILAWRIQWTV